jgi:hypothetical protein
MVVAKIIMIGRGRKRAKRNEGEIRKRWLTKKKNC